MTPEEKSLFDDFLESLKDNPDAKRMYQALNDLAGVAAGVATVLSGWGAAVAAGAMAVGALLDLLGTGKSNTEIHQKLTEIYALIEKVLKATYSESQFHVELAIQDKAAEIETAANDLHDILFSSTPSTAALNSIYNTHLSNVTNITKQVGNTYGKGNKYWRGRYYDISHLPRCLYESAGLGAWIVNSDEQTDGLSVPVPADGTIDRFDYRIPFSLILHSVTVFLALSHYCYPAMRSTRQNINDCMDLADGLKFFYGSMMNGIQQCRPYFDVDEIHYEESYWTISSEGEVYEEWCDRSCHPNRPDLPSLQNGFPAGSLDTVSGMSRVDCRWRSPAAQQAPYMGVPLCEMNRGDAPGCSASYIHPGYGWFAKANTEALQKALHDRDLLANVIGANAILRLANGIQNLIEVAPPLSETVAIKVARSESKPVGEARKYSETIGGIWCSERLATGELWQLDSILELESTYHPDLRYRIFLESFQGSASAGSAPTDGHWDGHDNWILDNESERLLDRIELEFQKGPWSSEGSVNLRVAGLRPRIDAKTGELRYEAVPNQVVSLSYRIDVSPRKSEFDRDFPLFSIRFRREQAKLDFGAVWIVVQEQIKGGTGEYFGRVYRTVLNLSSTLGVAFREVLAPMDLLYVDTCNSKRAEFFKDWLQAKKSRVALYEFDPSKPPDPRAYRRPEIARMMRDILVADPGAFKKWLQATPQLRRLVEDDLGLFETRTEG